MLYYFRFVTKVMILPVSISATFANSIEILNPPEFQVVKDGKPIQLKVEMKTGKILNPTLETYDQVTLRSYNDGTKAAHSSFVGPTIRLSPGDTLNLTLTNNLPFEECNPQRDHNEPACFNYTNLHTHGLSVNPGYEQKPSKSNSKGIASDNVFITVPPKDPKKPEDLINVQQYQFKIPQYHHIGTNWYHPHLHGSTAIQVSSGMSGAIIIEGKRKPKVENDKVIQTGDIDILLNNTREKILIFQQIQYDDKGLIQNYDLLKDPSSWANSSRYTSINGLVLGKIEMLKNNFYRWRMIHGGVRDTLGLVIKKLPHSANLSDENVIQACRSYGEFDDIKVANKRNDETLKNIEKFNGLDSIIFNSIASDGITQEKIQKTKLSILQPGYRIDSLIALSSVDRHCIFDVKLDDYNEINSNIEQTKQLAQKKNKYAQLVGWINVTDKVGDELSVGDFKVGDELSVGDFLAASAKKSILPQLLIDQVQVGDLSAFIPYQTLENETKIRKNLQDKLDNQQLNFHIENGFKISNIINDRDAAVPYKSDHSNVRYLNYKVDGDAEVDEWILTSRIGEHPFHIHVNPFQIQRILDETGKDVSGNPEADKNTPWSIQFNNLKGIWKDTLLVPNKYTVYIRTKYDHNLTGDFVLHCHILDHEDRGMMQDVRICKDDESLEQCRNRAFPADAPTGIGSHLH